MKLTVSQLRRIIKEEVQSAMAGTAEYDPMVKGGETCPNCGKENMVTVQYADHDNPEDVKVCADCDADPEAAEHGMLDFGAEVDKDAWLSGRKFKGQPTR